jgi:hypothetical protein
MNLSPPLPDVLRALFGPDWRRRASAGFGRSRRQVARWCSGETLVPSWVIREIERRTLAAAANFERWKQAQIDRIEKEEARERVAAIGQALTWVKLLRSRDGREPARGVGRPRKGPPPVVKVRQGATPSRQAEWPGVDTPRDL